MKQLTKAILVILRHGQTDYNLHHLMTGQRDIPLNDTGIEQAKEAGRLMGGFLFDKVYSSHLSRAFNTACLALEHSGAHDHLCHPQGGWQVEQCPEIAEVDTGDFTGRCHKTDPEIINWVRDFNKPLPNGESDKQAVARVSDFFYDKVLPRLEAGENVLTVVHAGIVRAFNIVLGIEENPEEAGWGGTKMRRIPNATPFVVEFEDGVMVRAYHLDNPKELDAANQNVPFKKPKAG